MYANVYIEVINLFTQGCQDGVGMHTHETHCTILGVLAIILAWHVNDT